MRLFSLTRTRCSSEILAQELALRDMDSDAPTPEKLRRAARAHGRIPGELSSTGPTTSPWKCKDRKKRNAVTARLFFLIAMIGSPYAPIFRCGSGRRK